MKWRRCAAITLVLGLACGGAAEPASQPETVQVGLERMGQTVGLKVGDRLEVSLAEESSDSGAYRWELTGYPEGALDVVATEEEASRFEFVATGEGEGPVQLTGRPRCGRGLSGSDDDIQCPVLGAGTGGAPLRLFVITVEVTEG